MIIILIIGSKKRHISSVHNTFVMENTSTVATLVSGNAREYLTINHKFLINIFLIFLNFKDIILSLFNTHTIIFYLQLTG